MRLAVAALLELFGEGGTPGEGEAARPAGGVELSLEVDRAGVAPPVESRRGVGGSLRPGQTPEVFQPVVVGARPVSVARVPLLERQLDRGVGIEIEKPPARDGLGGCEAGGQENEREGDSRELA